MRRPAILSDELSIIPFCVQLMLVSCHILPNLSIYFIVIFLYLIFFFNLHKAIHFPLRKMDYLILSLLWYSYWFTDSRKLLPALKCGVFDAGIIISSFVRGFLPRRSERWDTENVPNPEIVTFAPFASVPMISSNVTSRISVTCFFVAPDFVATELIRSCRVIFLFYF